MHSPIGNALRGLIACLWFAAISSAQAQSVAPMSQKVVSFSDVFLVQFEIRNTYQTPQINDIELYTSDWTPLTARYVSRQSVRLGPNDKMIITALIPFSGQSDRIVYVCNSILPRVNGVGSAFKGEVCGKVHATQLQG